MMPHQHCTIGRLLMLLAVFSTASTQILAPRAAWGQGNVSFAETRFLSGRVLGDGSFVSSQVQPGSCVACSVDGSNLWLRISQLGCESRSVTVDLRDATSRVRDSDGDYLFEEGCSAPSTPGTVTLSTDPVTGVNTIHDLIFVTESPWKGNALGNGIRVERMALNKQRIGCDAFYLVYDERLRVTVTSDPNERIVETRGNGECTLYKNLGNRSLVLGRFRVPMRFSVIKRT